MSFVPHLVSPLQCLCEGKTKRSGEPEHEDRSLNGSFPVKPSLPARSGAISATLADSSAGCIGWPCVCVDAISSIRMRRRQACRLLDCVKLD